MAFVIWSRRSVSSQRVRFVEARTARVIAIVAVHRADRRGARARHRDRLDARHAATPPTSGASRAPFLRARRTRQGQRDAHADRAARRATERAGERTARLRGSPEGVAQVRRRPRRPCRAAAARQRGKRAARRRRRPAAAAARLRHRARDERRHGAAAAQAHAEASSIASNDTLSQLERRRRCRTTRRTWRFPAAIRRRARARARRTATASIRSPGTRAFIRASTSSRRPAPRSSRRRAAA